MEASGDVAVVLQLLLRHAVQEAAVDAAGQQVVGVLPKPGVNASQPVGQVAAVAGGVVGEGFQLRQLPEKPGRGERRSIGEAPFSCWTRKDTEMFGSMSSAVSDGVCQRAVVQNEQNGDKSLHGSGCAGPQGAEARGARLKDEEICKFTPFWVTCSILPQFLCHCWPLPTPQLHVASSGSHPALEKPWQPGFPLWGIPLLVLARKGRCTPSPWLCQRALLVLLPLAGDTGAHPQVLLQLLLRQPQENIPVHLVVLPREIQAGDPDLWGLAGTTLRPVGLLEAWHPQEPCPRIFGLYFLSGTAAPARCMQREVGEDGRVTQC